MKSIWQTKKLGEFVKIEKKQNGTKKLPYVGMEDIESNTAKFLGSATPRFVKSTSFYFNGGHVLYGRLRPYLNKVLLPDFEGHCSTEIFPIKVGGGLNKKFLFYWLTSDDVVVKINATCTGSRMPRANVKEVLDFEIPLPPLLEQFRIVKILDEVFERVGKVKENTERNLKNSRLLFESYLSEVFSNPKFTEKKLDEVCDVEYGYTEKAKGEGDFRFVRITDTDENGLLTRSNKMYIDKFSGFDKYLLSHGDLLMARTGASAGNVLFFEGDEKAVFASYLIRMKFKKEVSSKLYWYFSKSKMYWDQVKQLSAGSAQPQFNGGALKQIIFPFPESLSEQKAIVVKLDALSAETKKLEGMYRQKIADVNELKKSVLKSAFAGKM